MSFIIRVLQLLFGLDLCYINYFPDLCYVYFVSYLCVSI